MKTLIYKGPFTETKLNLNGMEIPLKKDGKFRIESDAQAETLLAASDSSFTIEEAEEE